MHSLINQSNYLHIQSFDDNGKCVSDKNVAVNKFNQYFVNVGLDLANKNKKNEYNLFLSPVLEEDIITTIKARLCVIITILIWS